jgi:hypothetical protein
MIPAPDARVHVLGESRFGRALQYAPLAVDALSPLCQRRLDEWSDRAREARPSAAS